MAKKKDLVNVEDKVIDKEKLEEELRKEIKEKLLDDLSKHVEVEIKGKLDKMEKRILKQKNRSLFRKNILIILLIATILFEGKILYDNGLLDNNKGELSNIHNTDEDNKKITEEVDEIKDKSYYINKYGYLVDNINTNLIGDNKYYLYKDNYNIEDIENNIKLNIAYQLLDDMDILKNNGFITVDSVKLKEKYETIFNDKYNNENFSDSCINYIYNEKLNKYLAIDIKCEEDNDKLIKEILEIEEKDNKIYILVEVTLNNEKIGKYKYTFIEEDNNCFFKGIEKMDN